MNTSANYRFLLKPHWIAFLLVGAILAVSFTSLGFWQLYRLEQRKARNTLIQHRLSEGPQALLDLVSQYDTRVAAFEDNSIAHRPVKVQGVYDTDHEVLLRTTQNYQGLPGYYVLTPLLLPNNQAVLVMRGWVPFEMNTLPLHEATPPAGEIEMIGTVEQERKPTRGMLSALTPQDPPGKLSITAYIDTERLETQMPYDLLPVYIRLENQTPAQTLEFPKPLEALEFTNGPHLGYAIQWFSFTLIGVIGYILLIRKVARDVKEKGESGK
jgi:surfeit locus 1 family protein